MKVSGKVQTTQKFSRNKKSERKNQEVAVYGIQAVRILADQNPVQINRFFCTEIRSREFGSLLAMLAREKKVYRIVSQDDLAALSGSDHHEGVVAILRSIEIQTVSEANIVRWQKNNCPLILFAGISNPHNLGAIIRTATFLGFYDFILLQDKRQAEPSGSVYRVAEGGMQFARFHAVKSDVTTFCQRIQKTHLLLGSSARGKISLQEINKQFCSARTTQQKPFAVIFGNEESGIHPAIEKECEYLIRIPGVSQVESLNVSVAAGIILWHLRQIC